MGEYSHYLLCNLLIFVVVHLPHQVPQHLLIPGHHISPFFSGLSHLHFTCQVSSCICCWCSRMQQPRQECQQKYMVRQQKDTWLGLEKKTHGLAPHWKQTLEYRVKVQGWLDPYTGPYITLLLAEFQTDATWQKGSFCCQCPTPNLLTKWQYLTTLKWEQV